MCTLLSTRSTSDGAIDLRVCANVWALQYGLFLAGFDEDDESLVLEVLLVHFLCSRCHERGVPEPLFRGEYVSFLLLNISPYQPSKLPNTRSGESCMQHG